MQGRLETATAQVEGGREPSLPGPDHHDIGTSDFVLTHESINTGTVVWLPAVHPPDHI
jgi:hypothetical protein